MKLYNTDYVLFFVNSGTFEFEQANYPYIYSLDSVQELLLDVFNRWKYDRDHSEVWVPTTELPKEKRKLLIKMVSEVK
jgi:hypothetical protein